MKVEVKNIIDRLSTFEIDDISFKKHKTKENIGSFKIKKDDGYYAFINQFDNFIIQVIAEPQSYFNFIYDVDEDYSLFDLFLKGYSLEDGSKLKAKFTVELLFSSGSDDSRGYINYNFEVVDCIELNNLFISNDNIIDIYKGKVR